MEQVEVLDNFVMPANARANGAKGTKYLNEEQRKAIKGLKVKQAVIIPFLDGTDAKKQRSMTATVLKNQLYVDKGATYAVGVIDTEKAKGIAIQCLTEAEAIAPEAEEKK